ncbi:acetyl-CoA carboxylase biotin carboxyl carrier protein [Lignipirellula cremea]|uniref:Biotin carboxyl carrier protein of acetyl-CoA carboxylase n=1 Tax=Lignipirellula cremea TaxID=2528010 RepID=A0A518DY52_9BACT|nr:acetyl-CoA carboxylase biotin carboxyl carrier protein [Lignipirellula cremea]QDU96779.1 Acetyl-CoA biotin carboxyl carrier [Lignipirellula cremea]
MADSPAGGESPVFSVDTVRSLIELMLQHDINEIDLREDERRIRLRRGQPGGPPVLVQAAPSAPAVSAAPPVAGPLAVDTSEDHLTVIKSPMIGTFYAAPNPDASPYVKVGDHIGPETTVCMIESMKMFTEVPAETSGKVVAVLVKNGDSVDVNRPLFKIDPS